MCNFNNLIFFALILFICVSTGNSLKCYNCTTSDDKSACDHSSITQRNDTESEKQVCLTIEYSKSNDANSKYITRKLFSIPSEKNITEACVSIDSALAITKNVRILQPQFSQVMESCTVCDKDLCNSPPAPQVSSSISIRLQQSSFCIALAGTFLNFYKMYFL